MQRPRSTNDSTGNDSSGGEAGPDVVTRFDVTEDIAILGIGLRLPGGAADPQTFWEILRSGSDVITEVPDSRWKLQQWYDPEPQAGKTYARWGGFIDDVAGFDAAFFGVSPREAAAIDPQQRLLLQTAYEALEDAGQTPEYMRGKRTGVYVGMWGSDYEDFLFSDPAHIDFYRTQGTGRYTAAGRLSFVLGLDGPSLAVDTACSSSLVTVHLACQAIRNGDCELAIAGGANLLLQPQITIAYSQSRMMATDGRCRFGDASGSGYVRSEGVGLVVLKKLSDALADRDPVYAVIRGSAVNNDGKSSGSFGTPGIRGQEAMLRTAYRNAGVDPREVRFIEAHGTGTKRGDPVEVRALANVLCEERSDDRPLLIGSVKTNIGHMEAAAGIGGLLKATLALDRGAVPPSLHFKTPNPSIPFQLLPIKIPTELTELPDDGQVHYAGVNSFGISGTNAHIVLSESPRETRIADALAEPAGIPARYVLNLTAKSVPALRGLAEKFVKFLSEVPDEDQILADICYTLSVRRNLHEHRLSAGGESRGELIEALQAFLSREERVGLQSGQIALNYEAPPVREAAFVYSGQGSQWPRMGRDLYQREAVFRASLDKCDREIKKHTGWSVIEEIERSEGEGSRLNDIDVMWPAVFAVQVALTEYLESLGIRPSAVVGHSIGEAAAAWASGALSFEDAAQVIVTQGKLVHETSGQGAMALVGLGFPAIQEELEKLELAGDGARGLVAAIESSPDAAVVSGEPAAVKKLVAALEDRGVFARPVNTGAAVHSAQMEPLKERLLSGLAGLNPGPARIPFYSGTNGTLFEGSALTAEYFWENLRQPVLFASAVDAIFYDGPSVFVEISPHPIVTVSVQETIRGHQNKGFTISSLRNQPDESSGSSENSLKRIGATVQAMSAAGVPVDIARARNESAIPALSLHTGKPRLAFVFSGQGPQWWGMGRELYAGEPVFRAKIDEIDALLEKKAGWKLLDELIRADESESRLDETRFAQPAIFALQVGLAELWRSWGVEPDAIAGHSVGEVAAAHVSGKLSLAEAVHVIHHRGSLMQEATGLGKMAAIEAPLEKAREFLEGYEDRVSIGAANSPTSTVLSGETAALEEVLKKVEGVGIHQKLLPVNYAFHSPQMEPFKIKMNEAMQGLKSRPARVPIVSTVTGELADEAAYGAEYWGDNIRQGVLFAPSVDTLIENDFDVFLEIGPHPVLSGYVLQCLEQAKHQAHAIPSLRRNQPEHRTLLGNLGALFVSGYPIDWRRMYSAPVNTDSADHASEAETIRRETARCVRLPAYAWQTERFWIDPPKQSANRQNAGAKRDQHPLLQNKLDTAQPIYEAEAGANNVIFDSLLNLRNLLSPLALLESALSAGLSDESESAKVLCDANWHALTTIEGDAPLVFQHLCSAGGEETEVQVFDRPERSDDAEPSGWTRSFSARIRSAATPEAPALEELQSRLVRDVSADKFYGKLQERELATGRVDAASREIKAIHTGDAAEASGEVLLRLDWNPERNAAAAGMRLPANVLAAIQQGWHYLGDEPAGEALLPESCEVFHLAAGEAASPTFVYLSCGPTNSAHAAGAMVHIHVYGEHGQVLASVGGLLLRSFSRPMLLSRARRGFSGWLYEHVWEKSQLSAAVTPTEGLNLIFADEGGRGAELASRLIAAGQRARLVYAGAAYQAGENDDAKITLPPRDSGAFKNLLADLGRDESTAVTNIIFLWGVSDAESAAGRSDIDGWSERLEATTGALLYLTQALLRANFSETPRLIVVSRGARAVRSAAGQPDPEQATLWGLGTGIETEHPELRCRRIDLDPAAGPDPAGLLCAEILSDDAETRVAFRGGKRYVERLAAFEAGAGGASVGDDTAQAEAPEQAIALDSTGRGTVENLILRPMDRRLPGPDEVEIRVRATGLNYRDVLSATGEHPDGPVPFGIECAGEIASVGENITDLAVGDAVIALTLEPSFATYVTVPADLVIQKPAYLDFTDAATIPVVFLTAFYALHRFGRIAPGDRVLIHSAAGGVGLAAIQLARLMGAEIYATVGTEEKRTFLGSMGVQNLYSSRSLDFADEILADTDGEGVDIVLNSLAGEFVPKGIGLLRENGRFIEIGKKNPLSAKEVARIKKRVSYFTLDLMDVASRRSDLIQSMLLHLAEEFAGGDLQPLPRSSYELSDVQTAFMDMARGRHIGKLVVEHNGAAVGAAAAKRFQGVRSDGSYLISGGLGGLGLLFARSLAEQGAGHLILTGRSEPGAAARVQIAEIEAMGGTQVHVVQGDVSVEADVIRILETIDAQCPPLLGVLHTAGIVRDGLLLGMNWRQCEEVLAAKLAGSFYLHKHTRNRPLDLFVLFSSIVATVGSSAQANYAAANAYMDALAHYRRSLGLAGLSVNWGPWADAGMAAELAGRGASNWTNRGISFLPIDIGVDALGHLLREGGAQAGVYHIDWELFAGQFAQDGAVPAFFARLVQDRAKQSGVSGASASAGDEFLRSLQEAPAPARKRAVFEHVREQIAKILGLASPQAVDAGRGFKDMGLDSLMTVELRNRLQKNLQSSLPSTLAFDYPTVNKLTSFLDQDVLPEKFKTLEPPASGADAQSEPTPESGPAADVQQAGAPPTQPNGESTAAAILATAELDELSDDEAEALLLQELNIFKARKAT